MSWDYKLLDHTADFAAEIRGDTLEDLLHAGYKVWRELVAEPYSGNGEEEKILEFSEVTFEELLVGFLSELNYLFLFKKWIPSRIIIESFNASGGHFGSVIKVIGQKYGPSSYILKSEIKAVTFHRMEVKKINGKYVTLIVFDI